MLDLSLNYRQSGHPGGSRSKVHLFLSLLLSGAMRWDIRTPWRTFADRFVLSAGHTVPLVYTTLAVLNETLRARHEWTGDGQFAFPDDGRWALTWEDLLRLRHRGGLAGHAEMEGKTLFLKFNTGPSGHGMPPAAGEALALKLAGCGTSASSSSRGRAASPPAQATQTRNAAWGLGLSNLVFLVDWNDFGIDEFRASSVVPGTPETWFGAYDWRVTGTLDGMRVGAGDASGPRGGSRRALTEPLEGVRKRAKRLAALLRRALPEGLSVSLLDGVSMAGGGSLPTREIPTVLVGLRVAALSAAALEERLRRRELPVIVRVADEQVLLRRPDARSGGVCRDPRRPEGHHGGTAET